MQVPLELHVRGLERSEALEALIREQVDRLHRFAHDIIAVRIAVERPQQHQRTGNPFRVRIEVTIPPNHDLVVAKEPGDHDLHDELDTVVRHAFRAMERQVKETVERRRLEVKRHGEGEAGPAAGTPAAGGD
jgi:ribosomal subunit interface protein